MGGLDDEEPPSKRVKASSRELKGLSNGKFLKEPASCSFGASMARPLASQGDDEVIGSKGVKKVEFVKIIAEALYSLGYSDTGACLEEESGIPFHSSTVSAFIQQILDGNLDGSLASLHKIGIVDESIIKSASFIILQQKFFELLDHDKLKEALKTLRTEISSLLINCNRVRELSSFILSPTYRISDGISSQGMVKSKTRSELLEDLQKLFPPTVMIPDKRLLQLIEQALDLQREACLFHNSSVGETSLFTDHHCGRDQIPSQTVQVIRMFGPPPHYITLPLLSSGFATIDRAYKLHRQAMQSTVDRLASEVSRALAEPSRAKESLNHRQPLRINHPIHKPNHNNHHQFRYTKSLKTGSNQSC